MLKQTDADSRKDINWAKLAKALNDCFVGSHLSLKLNIVNETCIWVEFKSLLNPRADYNMEYGPYKSEYEAFRQSVIEFAESIRFHEKYAVENVLWIYNFINTGKIT